MLNQHKTLQLKIGMTIRMRHQKIV